MFTTVSIFADVIILSPARVQAAGAIPQETRKHVNATAPGSPALAMHSHPDAWELLASGGDACVSLSKP